ncbi:hypothetical protein JTE90_005235 [Oedothorax gibbosus]|uniref:Uncharacterized protein n=1 Tax=Oedothorax gibbosus TaxID=931172 RepID=A0AAV6TS72_9ARAC|nr:hypothetical protein JTE90_005235 [Oedothorax gibbosus]
MSEVDLKIACDTYVQGLAKNLRIIPQKTLGQSSKPAWHFERRKRLSSSFFKDIGSRRASTPCTNLVKRIVHGSHVKTAAMSYDHHTATILNRLLAEHMNTSPGPPSRNAACMYTEKALSSALAQTVWWGKMVL